MYQALYRKYRPMTFDDVCGQEHITAILKEQIKRGKLSHAYMFCGSRGTGKTTCAKILSKAVNCENPIDGEPCNECSACVAINQGRMIDVVEMDAASNNSVDNIRELCDELQYLPGEGKKRVYIIDEVHMLTANAFNALLKTLEEPPEHVLFILATTETHKILPTIMSRCQRFDFKRIKPEIIADRIMSIAVIESIQLQREAAMVIAKLSDGAMRDALSLLEACTSQTGIISAEEITRILGLGNREMILDIVEAVAYKNAARTISLIGQLYEKLSDIKSVLSDIIKIYRDMLVIKNIPSPESFLECYESEIPKLREIAGKMTEARIYLNVTTIENFIASYDRISSGKKASAEILFIKLCDERLSDSSEAVIARIGELERCISSGDFKSTVTTDSKSPQISEKIADPLNENKYSKVQINTVDNNTERVYEGSEQLQALLQKEAMIKAYLSQIFFKRNGLKLFVETTPFIGSILKGTGCENIIKNNISQITPEINEVEIKFIEIKKEDKSPDLSGLI